jgi:hypothetical protein
MGTRLIVRDADFSGHRVLSVKKLISLNVKNESWDNVTSKGTSTAGYFVDANYADLQGCFITKVELKVASAGSFTFVVGTDMTKTDVTVLKRVTFTDEQIGSVVKILINAEIGESEIFGFNMPGDGGSMYFESENGSYGKGDGFYKKVFTGNEIVKTISPAFIGVVVYGYKL